MLIRFFDIVISTVAAIILLPFLLILAIIMIAGQGFPVVFSQVRSGKDFRPFRIYKLRTMKKSSEDELGLTKGLHDERITAIGFILRKYKIDELPQLFNIILGQMSVVGSRPQVPFYAEKFRNYYQKILILKPGLLSPSAIKFSNEEELLDKVDDPVKYYEETLVPVKCEMDIDLVTGFDLKKYFTVLFSYFKKIIFRA
ncbi:sugar transferase [Flavobacterium pallidum]|uniref:Glycosyl transferase n=1 Tax=Flavobacterium pallidum TaxID=2172098 RepID=A0A2S1SDH9_9FLAO|nr:sugar transferase [Flavobacterium pallidum]AWI24439.1 glycosyl transferase [Flavobacterium pallidum]